MENLFEIPEEVIESVGELKALVKANPRYIPADQVAKFFHMSADGLRCSIEQGLCPFGFAWQKTARGNKGFKIPSATLYLWYMNMCGMRQRRESA